MDRDPLVHHILMPKEKVAKVHTQTSLRARPRDNTERKVVFKGVLDNPHRVPW